MSTFKLLALRPGKGCTSDILKNLRQEHFYFFDNGYQPNEAYDFIRQIDDSNGTLDSSFFYKKQKDSTSTLEFVNIQAVVGKNGEGKSSLIDFAIRMLNNFHHLILPENHNQLLYIQHIYGELYFEIEHHIFRIKFNEGDDVCTLEVKINGSVIPISINEGPGLDWPYKDFLFFTLGINYSLYSWNAQHYRNEITTTKRNVQIGDFPMKPANSWLNRLFHKNDGYLTPLALHPYREEGIINVNREEFLTRQRLMSVCINPRLNFNKINEEQKFTSFVLSRKKNDSLLNALSYIDYVVDPKTSTDVLQFIEEHLKYSLTQTSNEDLLKIIHFFDELPKTFFEKIYQINRHLNDHKQTAKDIKENYQVLYDVLKHRNLPEQEILSLMQLVEKFQRPGVRVYVNERILAFALYLTELEKIWSEIISEHKMSDVPGSDFEKCIDYLVYKSISISRLYPKYKGKLPLNNVNLFTNEVFFRYIKLQEDCRQYINSLLGDRSHITLKIFQTLNYVCNYNRIPNYQKFKSLYLEVDDTSSKTIKIDIDQYSKTIGEIFNSYQLNEKVPLNKERFYLEFLPPPIYHTDLEIADINGNRTSFDLLSSGERQLINVTSSIIYHLKNIDSIELDEIDHAELFSYKYVNILLDEIELYFHPEYQRQFISRLLFLLKEITFTEIRGINFLLITHSPFILSDIPKNNVLFLEKGKPVYPMVENTFGANIHTLLQHGFFLHSSPIGEFAKDVINELFRIIHNNENLSDYPHLKQKINLVSEPFLKSQLLKLYHEKASPFKIEGELVTSLLKRISDLERKLNGIN